MEITSRNLQPDLRPQSYIASNTSHDELFSGGSRDKASCQTFTSKNLPLALIARFFFTKREKMPLAWPIAVHSTCGLKINTILVRLFRRPVCDATGESDDALPTFMCVTGAAGERVATCYRHLSHFLDRFLRVVGSSSEEELLRWHKSNIGLLLF